MGVRIITSIYLFDIQYLGHYSDLSSSDSYEPGLATYHYLFNYIDIYPYRPSYWQRYLSDYIYLSDLTNLLISDDCGNIYIYIYIYPIHIDLHIGER
ncbi:hypothetical protein I7I48_00038 [Histoplasma ohiense]|nr:hypothetical protein I7I48_00038 [Histoplasma ohiense (nom. inval.)]